MRYPKFSEFHEAKEKGLADEPAGSPNKYKDGGKGPNVPSDWTSKSGNTPNKAKDGGKGPGVGKGLADEKGSITKDQWVPKEGKKVELSLEKSLAGKDYKGFLATKLEKEEKTLPYDKPESPGVYIAAGSDSPLEGLAFDASPGLTADNSGGEKPGLKFTKKNIGKMTSEQFLSETGAMSPSQFTKFYEDATQDEPLPTVTDLYGNQFTPDPNQVIEYIAALAVKNPRLMTRLVREVKRHEGGFGGLFNESKDHPEFFDGMVESMGAPEGEGKKFCHKISRAMNDNYMGQLDKFVMEQRLREEVQPKGDLNSEDGGPLGKSPENPSGMAPPKPGGAFGGGMGAPQPGQPPQGGAMGGGAPGAGAPMPPAPGGAMGGGGAMMGGQEAGPTGPMPGMGMGGGPPMPPAAGFDGGGAVPPPAAPQAKLKGETAHGNMIEEMGGFPHFFTHMSDYCINGNCKDKKK